MSTWLINRRNKWNCVFRRLEGIFPGRLIEVSLQRSACIVSNGIAVYWLILCYCLLQNSMKSSRLGFARLWLPGTAILTSCFGSPGNYLNRIHLKAENSAFCDNPSFAYLNSGLWFFDKNIGTISKILTPKSGAYGSIGCLPVRCLGELYLHFVFPHKQ